MDSPYIKYKSCNFIGSISERLDGYSQEGLLQDLLSGRLNRAVGVVGDVFRRRSERYWDQKHHLSITRDKKFDQSISSGKDKIPDPWGREGWTYQRRQHHNWPLSR